MIVTAFCTAAQVSFAFRAFGVAELSKAGLHESGGRQNWNVRCLFLLLVSAGGGRPKLRVLVRSAKHFG